MAVHLVTGDDPSLVIGALGELIRTLVGSEDRSLMLDDFDGEEFEMRQAIDAAQTPPMFTERRVVVVRGTERFKADEIGELVAYVEAPLDSTDLVVVYSGRLPAALNNAAKKAGAITHQTAAPARAKDREVWYAEQIGDTGLRLDPSARSLLAGWLGEDAGRLEGILATLAATYGTGSTLSADDIRPFIGEAGGVPPWDLTDALDNGRTATALSLLHRMTGAGERHPLQIMAILQTHYLRLLSLDGSGAHNEASAAEVLGIKPGYPARKALDQARRLGSGGIGRAIELLANADLDLRGAKEWDDEMILDVLVARLSRLGPAGRSA